jgi:hypothetical protein
VAGAVAAVHAAYQEASTTPVTAAR